MTNELVIEAVKKLIQKQPQYITDVLATVAVQFQSMSDNRNDSLYGEPAREWRFLEHDISAIRSADDSMTVSELSTDDVEMITAAVLWYELNSRTDA